MDSLENIGKECLGRPVLNVLKAIVEGKLKNEIDELIGLVMFYVKDEVTIGKKL